MAIFIQINKSTDIFKLIENKKSTVKNFEKLYTIAPKKFNETKIKDTKEYNIVEYAKFLKRNDLIEFFNSALANNQEIELLELMVSSPEKIKEKISDINISELSPWTQRKMLNEIFNNFRQTKEERANRLYTLVINPKGGVDVNIVPDNYNGATFFYFAESENYIDKLKNLLEKINPDLNYNVMNNTILLTAIKNKNYEGAKLLIERGANVQEIINNLNYLGFIYNFITGDTQLKFLKLFIDNGLSMNDPIKNTSKINLFHLAIRDNNKELFNFLIENGADLNVKLEKGEPLLCVAILKKNLYFIKKLIEKGADVNEMFFDPPQSNLLIALIAKNDIETIEYLLEAGANKDIEYTFKNGKKYDLLTYATSFLETDKEYFIKVIELLGGEIPKQPMWSGFTRGDIEKFDIFFEKPYDWSCCPICLEYIERSDGCMFMSHDCAKTNHYYHKKLYDKFGYERYVGAGKKVEWCTVCGRITKEHKHLRLTTTQNPTIIMAPLNPEIQERIDRGDNQAFFDNANCIGFGGGGTEEKATRFRRLREYALEVQKDVNKKDSDEVLKNLIEEVWNAPLVRDEKIKKILEDKRWNINVKEFPENKKNAPNNNSNSPNIPFNGVKPTIINDNCIIMGEDEDENTRETNPKLHFHHETVGGLDHNGIYICQKDLAKAIEIKSKEFGLEDFGKCWWPNCKGILHPEELYGIIPEVLYNEYKKRFNKKMAKKNGGDRKTRKLKKQNGGNKESVLHELKNGVCSPPNFTHDGKLRKN